jgi:hypothetical protein
VALLLGFDGLRLKARKKMYIPVLKKSYGMVLVWAKHYEKARKILEEGIQQIESTKPYNWAVAA